MYFQIKVFTNAHRNHLEQQGCYHVSFGEEGTELDSKKEVLSSFLVPIQQKALQTNIPTPFQKETEGAECLSMLLTLKNGHL